jgi:uncharacterized protein (TIGR03083 family)
MSELSTARGVLALLHSSHDRLAGALDGISEDGAGAQSYDDDWNVGQVASHLGSGAEVYHLFLDAGVNGTPAPGVESMQPIWDEWNAKDPISQTRDAVVADAHLLDRLDGLSDAEQDAWHLELFGEDRDLANLLALRLNEHAVHTWDIVVAADPGATVAEDAVDVVLGNLAMVAKYSGQKHDEALSIEVRTASPERAFHLDLGPSGVELTPSYDDTSASAELTLPGEAFVRLVYGRLDPDHTPASVTATGVDLDVLRRTFPGV